MGMVTKGALSSLILADKYLLFRIPDSLTLEEAATIPVVYGTVIYGMIMVSNFVIGNVLKESYCKFANCRY